MSVVVPNAWVRVVHPRGDARLRVVCFPHAGGSAGTFAAGWDAVETLSGLPVEVCAVCLPGRAERAAEAPPATGDLAQLAEAVARGLEDSGALALPTAFYGHSLGALLAFEVAARLEDAMQTRSVRPPVHIFASAAEAPAHLRRVRSGGAGGVDSSGDDGDDDAFVASLERYGVLPAELRTDEALRRAVLPALRADMRLFHGYAGAARRLARTSVSVLAGGDDETVTEAGRAAWAEHVATETAAETAVVVLAGAGHFFLDDDAHFAAATRHVAATLARLYADVLPRAAAVGGAAPHLDDPRTVWEMVRDAAAAAPPAGGPPALVDAARGDVPYAEAWSLALRVAARVERSAAASANARAPTVGLMLPHSADYVCAMLGVWAAGGCLLVLEAHHPPEMLRVVCQTCNPDGSGLPDVVVTRAEYADHFDGALAGVPRVMLDAGWEDDEGGEEEAAAYVPRPGCLEDRAILMTTSGTSGVPKLIEGSQRFVQVGMLSRTTLAPYEKDVEREACSVMFVWEAPRALVAGHTCVVVPETTIIDPDALVDFLIAQQATRILTTPSLATHVLDLLSAGPSARREALQRSLYTWFLMGEVCTAGLVQHGLDALPSVALLNAYSTWEAADTCILRGAARWLRAHAKFYPVGCLHEGVKAVVLDPETRVPVPRHVPGELFTTGPQLANGYAMAPELTAQKYVRLSLPPTVSEALALTGEERWYKSGDLAVMHEEGNVVELFGRIDSTVKIRGFKVGLPFVEAAVKEVEGVALCVVVPTFSDATQQPDALAALLSQAPDATGAFATLAAAVKANLAAKVPRWAAPTYYLPLEDVIEGDVRQGGEAKKVNRRAIPKLWTKEVVARFGAAATGGRTERKRAGAAAASAAAASLSGVEGEVVRVWCEALGVAAEDVDFEESFFDLGGHSLMASTLTRQLSALTAAATVTVLDLYENATLALLLRFVAAQLAPEAAPGGARAVYRKGGGGGGDVAIVGLAGRFPGADSVGEFWENLRRGASSPTFHTKERLRRMGVPAEVTEHADFVRAAYTVSDADAFDARFWGIGRAEAETMDPQHRLFIETAYNAVEHAGYAPRGGNGGGLEGDGSRRVGVYAAAGIDGYLVHHLEGGALKKPLEPGNLFMTEVASEKDYIATRVSYLLNLRGPSMNVNSACSSGLVAVAQACAAIAVGECDVAIAGASSLNFPNIGFLYQDGLVYSRDGLVRPLDAAAAGTAFGDSVGAVVLKRLEDAERDGDHVWAVVKGYGVSNDGNVKVGYAAPAAAGQADCINKAVAMSGLSPDDVGYVELHATGTLVGDGIEAKGLSEAWKANGSTLGAGATAVGSVKGNIGHANCAAGITGLIKTVMMLKHKELVPTANFKQLNEKVRFEGTPFYVNEDNRAWDAPADGAPRAAGVSSFGIGGTNAHIVLGEHVAAAPAAAAAAVTPAPAAASIVLLFSAKTKGSLADTIVRLAAFLETARGRATALTDVAHTLRTGRDVLGVRTSAAVAADAAHTAVAAELRALAAAARESVVPPVRRAPTVALLCPGQGSQYLGMARGLYERVTTFRRSLDECCEGLRALTGADLRDALFGGCEEAFAAPSALQPSLFAVSYAMGTLLMALGVAPAALAGHSIGEYVAAVLGGHVALADALRLIAARARAAEVDAPEGAMLSVALPAADAREAIAASSGLWLAADNAPRACVVSGQPAAVDTLLATMQEKGVKAGRLRVNRAFHSPLMAAAAAALQPLSFEGAAGGSDAARLPVASNVTGGWLHTADARTGDYWRRHMEDAVRFRENAALVFEETKPGVLVECGPGSTLSTLAGRCWGASGTTAAAAAEEKKTQKPVFEQSMRHATAGADLDDVQVFAALLGRLWSRGVAVDWERWGAETGGSGGRRVPLPGYAFEKTSFWVNPRASVYVEAAEGDAAPAAAAATAEPSPRLVVFSQQDEEEAAEVSLRLYCFPYAGGSSRAFEAWGGLLSERIEVVGVELPGRGARADRAHLADEEEDVREVCRGRRRRRRAWKMMHVYEPPPEHPSTVRSSRRRHLGPRCWHPVCSCRKVDGLLDGGGGGEDSEPDEQAGTHTHFRQRPLSFPFPPKYKPHSFPSALSQPGATPCVRLPTSCPSAPLTTRCCRATPWSRTPCVPPPPGPTTSRPCSAPTSSATRAPRRAWPPSPLRPSRCCLPACACTCCAPPATPSTRGRPPTAGPRRCRTPRCATPSRSCRADTRSSRSSPPAWPSGRRARPRRGGRWRSRRSWPGSRRCAASRSARRARPRRRRAWPPRRRTASSGGGALWPPPLRTPRRPPCTRSQRCRRGRTRRRSRTLPRAGSPCAAARAAEWRRAGRWCGGLPRSPADGRGGSCCCWTGRRRRGCWRGCQRRCRSRCRRSRS